MRNHEVKTVQKLLRVDGSLKEPGWSRQLLQMYASRNGTITWSSAKISRWPLPFRTTGTSGCSPFRF